VLPCPFIVHRGVFFIPSRTIFTAKWSISFANGAGIIVPRVRHQFEWTSDGEVAAGLMRDMLVIVYTKTEHWRLNFHAEQYTVGLLCTKLQELYKTAVTAATDPKAGPMDKPPCAHVHDLIVEAGGCGVKGLVEGVQVSDGALKLLVVPSCLERWAHAATLAVAIQGRGRPRQPPRRLL
jgi:hypothetical protein